MVRITYHTLPNWFWKKLQAGNQAEMLHPGIVMVNRNSSWLKFFKNFKKNKHSIGVFYRIWSSFR